MKEIVPGQQPRQKDQPNPQQVSVEGNPLISPIEQKGTGKLSPILEGEVKEEKFEITEREKQLLQVMTRVIAHGYLPSLRREPGNEKTIERIMLRYLDKFTSTPPKH
jgi:hypothetical protein